ncbi:UNVERIFIED_CONTAM: hypothetical protein K2H54_060515 [Gekko kuhli]
MGEEGAGEAFVGVVAGGDKDFEGVLPSDTVSLSDSDSDDFGFPDEAEVDTVSPEEPLALDDVQSGSDGSSGPRRSPVQPFHLKGMSSSFSQRSQSIFDCLEGAAKRAVPSLAEDNIIDGRFKRPLPPPNLSSKLRAENVGRQSRSLPSPKSSPEVPDYVAHPERWTKYSLEGVSETSEKANRSIAMEFLEGLRKNREPQSTARSESYTLSFNQDPSSSGAGRIVFTKPSKVVSDVSERKRAHEKEEEEEEEEEEEAKPKQELKGKPQKRPSSQKEDETVGLDHLDSGVKEAEDEKPLKLEAPGVPKGAGTDSAEALEDTTAVTVGFHGSKKRSRKHFRPKASPDEKEEDP